MPLSPLKGRAILSIVHPRLFIRPRNYHPASTRLVPSCGMATATDWRRVIPSSSGDVTIPSFSVFTKPIQKSQQDDREYRIIRLENGLEATLIHDAKADKAAASLDVSVGHLSDPDDMPGLAHFCEHLLFMGTEQYPRENDYSEFLAKNNGASNAYTSISNTNYYFSVATPALPQALARFAAFFHSPLFSPSCTSRELNAVDSEHKKNHQNDMWRIYQVNKHLSKPGHVWRKFGSGHRESLSQAARDLKAKGKLAIENGTAAKDASLAPSPIPSRIASPAPSVSSNSSESEADGGAIGRETRRRLVEWWTKEYCASRMNLCIVGKESLDELSNLASTLFSPIINRGIDPLPMIYDHPFGPSEKGTLVSVQTIMSFHALEISFPLEWQPPLWQLKPAQFIGHLSGHEGPGSLHSYLKKKGWITDLSSGPQSLARGFDMFKLTVYLTLDGFKNYRSVVLATFRYLALLRESQFPDFLQHEQVTLDAIRFRFKEKSRPDDYASAISARMPRPYPKDLLISAPSLTYPWSEYEDPTTGEMKVREYLESFRISNGRVVLMAKKQDLDSLQPQPDVRWETEPWYGSQYRVEKFDEEFIKQANATNDISELYLPGPNEFLPENLDVDKKEVTEPQKRPHLIRETPLSTLWHKKDDRFLVPKAYVIIDIRSAIANNSARAAVLTRLYSDLVTDSLTEYAYDASLAGLSYSFSSHATGLFVTMNGYNDKMPVLVQQVLEKGKGLVVDPERLAVIKEEVKRGYENFFLVQSYQLSDFYARYLMSEKGWTMEERLEELSTITAEELQQFIAKLYSEVNTRILVTGNIYKDEAIKMAEIAEQGLGASPLAPIQLNERALLIPEESNLTWATKILNPNQANFGLTYYVKYGSTVDQQLRVVASLLTQILKEPAFNILRTQEQLGYVVFCSGWSLPGGNEQGLRLVVQSEKTAGYCEGRVEKFLEGMKTTIEEMSPEVFEEQKNGLEKKWREAPKNLSEETAVFNVYIESGHLDFLRNENDANLLKSITKDDVLSLFMSRVHPASKTRSKLSVHMRSQKPRPKRVSPTAADAFESLVRDAALEVDETAWRETLGEDAPPTVSDFQGYWSKVFEGKAGGEDLLKALPALVNKYPVEGEEEDSVGPDVRLIEDPKAFRGTLQVAADPGPIVQWGDLPPSKL